MASETSGGGRVGGGTNGGGSAMLGKPGGGLEKSGALDAPLPFSVAPSVACSVDSSTLDADAGAGDEMPDSGRRDDRLPPPMTSMAPAIFRAGGGPAFFTATEPAYFEFSLTTAIGIGAGGTAIYSSHTKLHQLKKNSHGFHRGPAKHE